MDKLIEKIRKLLALAEKGRGATEAEAEAAMAKAQELMQANNLEMATVEASQKTGEVARAKEQTQGKAMYAYQQRLMAAIAAANFCSVWVLRRGSKAVGYQLIGRQSNVATVRVMFDYLNATINRVVMDAVNNDHTQRMTRYATAFAEGCADRLAERLNKRHQDYLKEQARTAREANAAARHPASGSTANALVVVMQDFEQSETDANRDFQLNLTPGTTTRRRQEAEASDAAAQLQRKAHAAGLVASGMDPDVADMVSRGWKQTAAEEYVNPAPTKPETAKQRAAREEKDARADARMRARWARQDQKRDWRGYEAGQAAGDDISLDRQINRKEV